MPRDGSGIYTQPFPNVVEGTEIESTVYNGFTSDVALDLNSARPIVAGGTGATNAPQALGSLGAERSGDVVINYDSHIFYAGSFSSSTSATGGPVDGHAFAGIAYDSDAIGAAPDYVPLNNNVIIEVRDQNDTTVPGRKYVREKKLGTWGDWKVDGLTVVGDAAGVGSEAADMFVGIEGTAPNSAFVVNTESDNSGTDIIRANKDGTFAATGATTIGGTLDVTANTTVGGSLAVSGQFLARSTSINYIGPAGTASGASGILYLDGASAAGGGGALSFGKNGVQKGAALGNYSAIFGGSETSDDFTIYNIASGLVLRVNATTGAATITPSLDISGNVTIGTGTTGGNVARLTINGGSGTSGGPVIQFSSNTSPDWYCGMSKAITGSGTSTDFAIFRSGGGAAAINISRTDDTVSVPSKFNIGGAAVTFGLQSISFNGLTHHGIAIDLVDSQASASFLSFSRNGAATHLGSITNNAGTGVAYNVTSDRRLKEDERPYIGAQATIDALKVWDFKWKSVNERGIGVFAQDAQQVFKDAVTAPASQTDVWMIDYSKFVPLLIADAQETHARLIAVEQALQEAMARIEALEARVEELESPI